MRRLVVCRIEDKLIEALWDGELSPRRARRLWAHVELCGRCQTRLRELERTRQALLGVGVIEPSEGFAERVMAAVGVREESVLGGLAEALEVAEEAGAEDFVDAVMARVRAVNARTTKPAPVRMGVVWAGRVAMAVAAAAALAMMLLTPSARRALTAVDERLGGVLQPAREPLGSIRGAAEALVTLRLRQAREAGLKLEDVGWIVARGDAEGGSGEGRAGVEGARGGDNGTGAGAGGNGAGSGAGRRQKHRKRI